jgi:hypothetical protein
MLITKVTLQRTGSTAEDVNAGTKGLGVRILHLIAIDMSKRIGEREAWELALPNHNNAP